MKVAILTSENQWFIPYAKKLEKKIVSSKLIFNHLELTENYQIVFILSYHKIIPENILSLNKHNIVIHSSDLPQGKGWAPMFWQIIEGKNEIPFTMFEASNGVDNGDIYLQKTLKLTGFELHDELREKQANFTIEMCLEFLQNYDLYKNPKPQIGKESFYKKRNKESSKLDIDKTIKEQFNLLRVVSNEDYPAFFEIENKRYVLKVEEMGGGSNID